MIVVRSHCLPARSAPAAIGAANPVPSRRAERTPSAAGRLRDRSGVLRQRMEATRLLGLRVGRQSHRAQHKSRCSQSHRKFSHETLLLVGGERQGKGNKLTARRQRVALWPVPEPPAKALYGRADGSVHTGWIYATFDCRGRRRRRPRQHTLSVFDSAAHQQGRHRQQLGAHALIQPGPQPQ